MEVKARASTMTSGKNPPTKLSRMPSPTAAMAAPAILPNPPMMMIANALNTKLKPISGCTA
jgi:hypothetical protein